ncbi:transcriptional regulator, AcrR family [Agrilactobacillus composti DSM 18527 = JCM 14202]|uniref:Transcriptional regulator, AcrR family n=1 Tax=Agrilactobacillus composti DSM 18527 = JCM 14202 TaxID=1423734 RepID=X0PFS6_9LACO|nr:TetR/AcrR family transcriptional regulator [Agrilactobacillus composti]KRM30885.1 transcriptional regulator, AcrR family [Agrilactobacillus composti DSM 18527 = JCM 14202]GAF40819.1 transcriptional regulator, TetR family [Agrilactobacillus composti DSM 18527 = JCM 14202]
MGKKQTRRRGKVLEDAILRATWQLLNQVGYNVLTIQAVAKIAGTNKNAIYRRWADKARLVVSALAKFGPKPDIQIPDTGNLRTDLGQFFEQAVDYLTYLTSDQLAGLWVDRLRDISVAKMMYRLDAIDNNYIRKSVTQILHQAEKRGELTGQSFSDRVLNLPALLVINAAITAQGKLTQAAMAEIIDDILMPVFSKHEYHRP